MSLTYNIPKNSPASSVRLYRFPYQGERLSDRMNLLMQAIDGDLKHIYSVLEDTEDVATEHLGGMSLLSIPPIAFEGFNALYMLAPYMTPYLAFNTVTITAGKLVSVPVSLITPTLTFGTVTIALRSSVTVAVSVIALTATCNGATPGMTTSIVVAADPIVPSVIVNTVASETTGSVEVDISLTTVTLSVEFGTVTITAESQTIVPVSVPVSLISLSATVGSVTVTAEAGTTGRGGIGVFGRRIIT
jgi:hypothetical protein